MATPQSRPWIPLPAVAGLMVAALAAAGVYALVRYGSTGKAAPALTPEAKAYTRNLKLSDVEMKAIASYLGHEIVEITGRIGNAGDRPLKQVDLNCVFYDVIGQVVLRERVSIVRTRTGGLEPGETKPFRLPFENVPQAWNKTMPQLVIAGIVF